MPLHTSRLAKFQMALMGKWENKPFDHGSPVGGPNQPLSYNIMPLPEENAPDGYILKNFKYHETLTLNGANPKSSPGATVAEAPNRGGLVSQNVRALFYDQQVKFSEGPAGPGGPQSHPEMNGPDGAAVHVENGAWLWLPRCVQQDGAFPDNIDLEAVVDSLAQPADISIAKQIAVPHGNSILALGSFDTTVEADGHGGWKSNSVLSGQPTIPDAPRPYPVPPVPVRNKERVTDPTKPSLLSALKVHKHYTTKLDALADFQNPHPHLTQHPNLPLQQAVDMIKPDHYMHWHVTTEQLQNGKGSVTSIPFERRVSEVTEYWADYWLLFKGNQKYLAYTQTILMLMTIVDKAENRTGKYVFPHVTCNTLTFAG